MSLLDAYAKTVVDQGDIIKAQANEIERLREALKKVELRSGETHIVDLVRSALQQKDSK